MKKCLPLLVITFLSLVPGCGNSPYDNGKAYAKTVISSIESGNPSALQKALENAKAKTEGMSPNDAAKFLQGYNEVAMPYMKSKMPKGF